MGWLTEEFHKRESATCVLCLHTMPPPASPTAAYRALLKDAMRARQQRILLLVWLSAHIVLTAALRSPRALFRTCVVLGSVALVATSALPLLLARRARLIAAPRAQAPRTRVAALCALVSDAAALHTAALHAAAAGAAALVYAATATQAFGWSHALSPMIWVSTHHAYYVNEALIVCVLAAAGAGAVYAAAFQVWPCTAWHSVPQFDMNVLLSAQPTLRVRFTQRASRAVPLAAAAGLAGALVPLAAYMLVREHMWAFVLRIVGVQSAIRRFVVPSFRVPYAPVGIALAAVPVLLLTLTLFAVAHTLFDVYWTHPLPPLALRARDPNVTLLGGLSDEHPFFACHAFGELARLARYDKPRRQLLFDDVQRQHGRPAAWTGVRVACIKALEHAEAQPEAEAKAAAAAAAGTRTAPAANPNPPPAPAPAPARAPTVWQQLLTTDAPQSSAAPPPPPPRAPQRSPPSGETHLFRVLRIAQWLAWHLCRTAWALVPADAKHVLVPTPLIQWLTARAPSLCVNAALRDGATQACCAADALQHLVVASVAEDSYGSVQKDVPVVVRALTRASEHVHAARQRSEADALEQDSQLLAEVRAVLAQAGGSAASFSTAHAPFYNELQQAWLAYEPLALALRSATREIVDRFAPYGIA